MMILYKFLLSSLVAFQIIGPSWLLVIQHSEVFAQETSPNQVILAGMRGVVTVTPGTNDRPGYAPKYRSELALGDVISTEEESIAEILLENKGLVTIHEYSEAVLGKKDNGGVSVALQVGAAEWSVPTKREEGVPLTFTTPNIRATTQGGLVTAEVQPTFSKMADTSQPHNPFLIRTSLRAQNSSVKDLGLLETFCVSEGSLSVEYPGSQQGMWQQKTVEAGKCVGFLNGQLRALGPKNDLDDWRAVCLVGTHCEIPESAKKLIAKKQMRQALALEEALVGSEAEEGEVDDEVVLATTAANFQSLDTGSFIPEGPQSPCIIDPNRCESGFPPSPNVGGSAPPPTPFFNNNTGGGGNPPPPPSPLPSNIRTAASLWPPNGMPGGQGLLNFIESDFMADIELVGVDSGNLSEAPHQGKAPEGFFVVKDLSPVGAGPPSTQSSAAAGLPSNQDVPMDFVSFHEPPAEWYGPVAHRNHNPKVQLGVGELAQPDVRNTPSKQAELLAQFARSPLIDPTNIFDSVAETAAESGCQLSSLSCFEIILESGPGALGPNPKVDADAGIDASIQARSSSTPGDVRLVTLKKGVVLGGTQVSLALQEKTNASFSGLEPTLGQAIEGAAVAILGKPGDPAIVNVEDRILAILGGSRIQPANTTVTTALLAVLDSTLRGPVAPSVIGKDDNGGDILREDVSPIIEVIGGSADVTTAVMVGSTANSSQTDVLDQALLEASSPLFAMINGDMTTASDFGRVAGKNAKLVANLVSGDALVRLAASKLNVNGNLFSVTGGAQMSVNGSLLSVSRGSSVTIGGAIVSVGAGSSFSLTNGALVDFGVGNNVVAVTNSLCAGGGCFSPFANPNWKVAGNPADFTAAQGFKPFVDLGTFSDGSVNQLNVGQDSAVLAVESGGSINLK